MLAPDDDGFVSISPSVNEDLMVSGVEVLCANRHRHRQLVGGLLCQPSFPTKQCGVLFQTERASLLTSEPTAG